jgi:hypothetical protein
MESVAASATRGLSSQVRSKSYSPTRYEIQVLHDLIEPSLPSLDSLRMGDELKISRYIAHYNKSILATVMHKISQFGIGKNKSPDCDLGTVATCNIELEGL